MSRPTWTRTAVKAARTAWLTGQIASTVGTATELPKPLAEQYSDYTTQVRTEQTRKDVRDRLDTGTRTAGQPTTSQDIKKLRKQIRP